MITIISKTKNNTEITNTYDTIQDARKSWWEDNNFPYVDDTLVSLIIDDDNVNIHTSFISNPNAKVSAAVDYLDSVYGGFMDEIEIYF